MGYREGTVRDPLGSKADTRALDELAQADAEELKAEAVPHLFRKRSSLTSALSYCPSLFIRCPMLSHVYIIWIRVRGSYFESFVHHLDMSKHARR